jgi:chromosome segregation ATPase
MSFDYDRLKSKSEEHGSWWTSYADLFMVLSLVFLLLYVTASLRTGSSSIQQKQEVQKVARRNEELEEQIRVYNTLKEDQLQTQSDDEQKTYSELMDKLSLLQDQATQEKRDLMQRANENARKAVALNKYQQIIRNIIDANVLAKSQIQVRNQKLTKQGKELQDLGEEIREKEEAISENEQRISQINQQLAKSIADVKRSKLAAHLTKKQMAERIAKLRKQSENKIQELEGRNSEAANEINSMRGTLSTVQTELGSTRNVLNKTQAEKEQLAGELVSAQAEAERKIAALRAAHAAKMAGERAAFDASLRASNLNAAAKAKRLAEFQGQADRQAQELQGKISALSGKVQQTEAEKAQLAGALASTQGALASTQAEAERKIGELRAAHAAKLASERAAFDASLRASNLDAAAKAKRLAEFQGQADRQAQELQGKISALSGKVKDTESQLAGAERDKSRYVASIEGLKGDLARSQEIAQARQKLAQRVRENLAKAGIAAKVDPKTGEVTISFGEDYFNSGSADLTPTMRKALNDLMPVYSSSLLGDAKTADKIANVEIIGFASPTYKGHYVNPKSLAPADQEAVNYNLKLSFSRANAIFRHVFNPQKLSFKHQKDLLPLVKVVGRGFLPEGVKGEDIPGGLAENKFCEQFNCQRAQRVILKFNLKD